MSKRLKLGGHYYRSDRAFLQKADANKEAKSLRMAGHKARVIRQGNMWAVYSRR